LKLPNVNPFDLLKNNKVKTPGKGMPTPDIISDVLRKTDEEIEKMVPINIMIIGKTGVGKSTLINSIFREELATTGIGKPVTEHLQRITKDNIPIVIYDSKGLELSGDSQKKVQTEINNEINRLSNLGEKDRIHAVWYCINAASNRVEETEIEWIRELSIKVPVIVVLTLSIHEETSEELKKYIENHDVRTSGVIRVLSKDYNFGAFKIKSFGLKELVKTTYDVISEETGYSFINAQKVDIDKKAEIATRCAKRFTYETFLVGFVPIPFADAPIISASQLTMIAKITSIFGVTYDKAMLTSVVSAAAGVGGAVVTGRYVVTNLLKLIPGAGTIATGLISGTTAAGITTALAYAYINVMKIVAAEEYKGNKLLPDEVMKLMKNELSKFKGKIPDFNPSDYKECDMKDKDGFVFKDKDGKIVK